MLHQIMRDICSQKYTIASPVPLLCSGEWAQSGLSASCKSLIHHSLKMLTLGCSTVSYAHTERKMKRTGKSDLHLFQQKVLQRDK